MHEHFLWAWIARGMNGLAQHAERFAGEVPEIPAGSRQMLLDAAIIIGKILKVNPEQEGK